jgi:hypothetical protein
MKTREHVFPKWLIALTGEPNRKANFGLPWAPQMFAFDQFQFPACRACNGAFSVMEERSCAVVKTLLKGKTVHCDALRVMLDWFDKLRVGIWLSELMLHENPFGIRPKFHISLRIGAADRILYIARTRAGAEGLSFWMYGDPVFMHCPSVATIRINHLAFVTFSCNGSVGPVVGHPYLRVRPRMLTRTLELAELMPAGEPMKTPAWPATSPHSCVVAQAIVPRVICGIEDMDTCKYPTKFDRSAIHTQNRGRFGPASYGAQQLLPVHVHADLGSLAKTMLSLHGRLRAYVVRRMPKAPAGDTYQEVFDKIGKIGQDWIP